LEINIGENLRFHRKEKKYTLEELSELVGVSRQTLSKWESGETYPDLISVVKLSNLYKVAVDVLIRGSSCRVLENSNRKYFCEMTKVSKDGFIKISQNVRDAFDIRENDALFVLCDSGQGIALVKYEEK